MVDGANNNTANTLLAGDENEVHQRSMRINRSVDEAYLLAQRDGFSLLDVAIDEKQTSKHAR